jgi:hypothetical protein
MTEWDDLSRRLRRRIHLVVAALTRRTASRVPGSGSGPDAAQRQSPAVRKVTRPAGRQVRSNTPEGTDPRLDQDQVVRLPAFGERPQPVADRDRVEPQVQLIADRGSGRA